MMLGQVYLVGLLHGQNQGSYNADCCEDLAHVLSDLLHLLYAERPHGMSGGVVSSRVRVTVRRKASVCLVE